METQERKIPTVMTVKTLSEKFFQGTVSDDLIQIWVKENKIPHFRLDGRDRKVLFDLDAVIEWWNQKIESSTSKKLRKIQ